MVIRYFITAGAGTTAGGKVMSGSSTGAIEPDGPRLSARFDGRHGATRPLTAAERASFIGWHDVPA